MDLDRIFSEVLEASKDGFLAEKYVTDIMNEVESKSNYPKTGSPLYYEDGFTGYYYVTIKAYLAFYRIDKNVMFVDRVLFGRSDYMRCLRIFLEKKDRE